MTTFVTSEDAPFVFGAYAAHLDRTAVAPATDAAEHPDQPVDHDVDVDENQG